MLKRKHKIIAASVALGLVAWMIDNIFDYYIFYRPQGFWDLLILHMPPHEAYIRSIILALFIVFGFYINRYIGQIEEVQGRYQQLFDSVNDAIFLISLRSQELPERILEANKVASQKLGYSREELLQLSSPDLTELKKQKEVALFLERLRVTGHLLFETALVSKDGRNIPVEVNAHEIELGGEVVYLAIVRDISERLEREKEIRRLASIPQFNPNPILEIDASGRITYCNDSGTKILQKLGVMEGPSSFLPDWDKVMEDITSNQDRQLCREVKIKNSIFAERIHFVPELGVVRLYATDITARMRGEEALRQAKDELEKRVVERTGELTLAYQKLLHEIEERQQAEEAVRQSAQQLQTLTFQLLNAEENERRLLSRTLHDELGQDLIFLKYKITPLAKKLEKDKKAKNNIDDVFQKLDEVIEKVRQISHYLSPTILEELGFSSAIKHLFEEFCVHLNCACKFSDKIEKIGDSSSLPHVCYFFAADGMDDLLSHQAQVNVYRILQETLTNISKHAQATRVNVGTKKQDGYFSLTIEDNGKGFDVQKTMAEGSIYKGMGLVSMQERVRMIGGAFNIESREGSGTKIDVIIPINQRGE